MFTLALAAPPIEVHMLTWYDLPGCTSPIKERAMGPLPVRLVNERLFEPPCARAALTARVPLPQVNQLPCDDSNVPSLIRLVMVGMKTFTSSTYMSTPA